MKDMFSDVGNSAQLFELKSNLQDEKQGNSSVTDYYNTLTSLWQKFDMFEDIVWKCYDDAQIYKKKIFGERTSV